jgi:hypothetical protein
MTFYRLADGVSFCDVGGRAVFLDLRRDHYFALDPASNEAFFRALGTEGILTGSDPLVANLLTLGLLIPTDSPAAISPAPCAIPRRSVLDDVAAMRSSIAPVAEIWASLARIRLRLRSGRLFEMIAELRLRKRSASRRDDPQAAADPTRAFLGARRYVPIAPNCLSDSLALAGFLARRGSFPQLVFGVKLDPFAAHCWLQTELEILNDASDRIREFVPVLVV